MALLVLAGCLFVAANRTHAKHPPARVVGSGLSATDADFNGELHLDTAGVQVGSNSCTAGPYSIHTRLAAVGGQAIDLLGPPGGLRIAAGNVRGDSDIGLVVRAWRDEPLAILTNDGKGTFSLANVFAFPDASRKPATLLAWKPEYQTEAGDSLV